MLRFIVNPKAGNGKGLRIWKRAAKVLQAKQIPYEVQFTQYTGHAKKLAQAMAEQPDTAAVVAVGGDGTVHEAANGIAGIAGSHAALGCIPAGSGDDFARGLGIPRNWQKALERVLAGAPVRIDAARINDGLFVISAGIGFDGEVARMTNRSFYKRLLNRIGLGSLSYVISVLRLLASYRPCQVRMELDGRTLDFSDVWLVAVANMPYYGGGMKICPDARHDDGILNVCLVHGIRRIDFLRFFPLVFQGSHVSHPSVLMLSGKRISIEGASPMAIHKDGESAGQTPVCIEALPGRLQAFV